MTSYTPELRAELDAAIAKAMPIVQNMEGALASSVRDAKPETGLD